MYFLLTFIFVKLRTHEKIVQVSLEKFYGIILQTHLLPQENKFGHNIFTLKIFPKLLDGKQTHGDWKCPLADTNFVKILPHILLCYHQSGHFISIVNFYFIFI